MLKSDFLKTQNFVRLKARQSKFGFTLKVGPDQVFVSPQSNERRRKRGRDQVCSF